MNSVEIDELNQTFSQASPEEVMQYVVKKFGKKLTLASSLGLEDQVLTHMFSTVTDAVDVFVLDTGRLHQETYNVIEKTMVQYAFNYRVMFPKKEDVEQMVETHGPNHFYQSVENRKE